MADTLKGSMAEVASPRERSPPRWRGLPLRWRLILLVVAGIVPLLAFALGDQYVEYRAETTIDRQRMLALARGMAQAVDGALEARVSALQTLATSNALHNGDLVSFRARAEDALPRQFRGASIELVDRDGREIVNTRLPPGAPPPLRFDLASLRRVFATGRPAVSDVFNSPAGTGPVIAIDVPVRGADGQVRYALGMHPPLDAFAEIIRRQDLPAGWVAVVTDRRGAVVARIPSGSGSIGRNAARSLPSPLRTQHTGIAETTSPAGGALQWAFSDGGRFGWAVAIGAPRAALVARAQSAAFATLAVGSGILAISFLLAIIAARRIAGPIATLRRLAAASDRDAWVKPQPTGVPEVDEVAEALFVAEDERRRSRRAEMLLRDGIESIPEGFAIYDAQDRLVMCNDNYRRLFPSDPAKIEPGAGFEDLVRAGLADGYAPAPAGDAEAWVARQVRDHVDPEAATEQRLADGHWALVRNRRLSNGGTAGLRIDITLLKTAQEALRTGEERFRRVVESLPNAILTVDPAGRIELINAAAEAMFGYAGEELVGQPVEILVPEPQRAAHPALRTAFVAAPQARP
ncbi:MAG TPA: PAS-domain containing protein, partial [Stellaceae bacterium]|nr:PAS-domain containing protein [Stellaceae bacterium]